MRSLDNGSWGRRAQMAKDADWRLSKGVEDQVLHVRRAAGERLIGDQEVVALVWMKSS
jgi:hypothetical protein